MGERSQAYTEHCRSALRIRKWIPRRYRRLVSNTPRAFAIFEAASTIIISKHFKLKTDDWLKNQNFSPK